MVKERVKSLLKHMEKNNFDAYIVPSADFHQSEYVAEHFKSRNFISGFTGSAGTVVITKENGHGLWTDGRYFLQAAKELKGSGIKLYKMHQPGVLPYEKWLVKNLKEKATIGLDGRLFSIDQIETLKKELKHKNMKIDASKDLINEIWINRPNLPEEKIYVHELKYAGKTIEEKVSEVREKMEEKYIDAYIISSLDDIAWLFNLRGNDISNNPVFLSYTVVTKDQASLYVNEEKLTKEAKAQLESSEIRIIDYNKIFNDVAALKDKKILCSKKKTSEYMASQLDASNTIVYSIDLTTHLKAQKNKVEIKNLKNVFVKDGIAMVKFLYWLDQNIGEMTIDEVDADEKLQSFRKEQALYKQDSFPYISGYGSNGAIIHYRAKKDTCSKLEPKGLYLIDSGGQYLDGTTDITRTVVLGELTKEEKIDFTLTLMGHIELAKAQFLEGTYGSNLDILARKPLWDRGLDYKHGTGHGVGFFLNVHEGPQNIALPLKAVTLKEGMLTSNEPGMYRDGKHGIRLENLILVQKSKKTHFGQFYRFETMTLCPIDLRGIAKDLMTADQIQWLNAYHKRVYEGLNHGLSSAEKAWLKEMTKEINI